MRGQGEASPAPAGGFRLNKPRSAAFALALLCLSLWSCEDRKSVKVLEREQLFTLGYGVLEDQLNLFSLPGDGQPLETNLAMRDGIFFISNGNAAKLLTLSAYGDLLSMVYNPERNPRPSILKQVSGATGLQERSAKEYPFIAPGKIAVDSRRTVFVVDQVPEDRRSFDRVSQASLEHVVLRFSRDGEYLDFLGQEGVGGTPFPFVTGLYITAADECVVACLSGEGWSAFWFDQRGNLLSTTTVRRDELPAAPDEPELIPSLEGMAPSPDGSGIVLKIDYYREIVDQETKTKAGIEFASTLAWVLDRETGAYAQPVELPAFESPLAASSGRPAPFRSWDFAGTAAGALFLNSTDEDGSTYYAIFDMDSKTLRRFALRIEPEELYYSAFSLSPEGILTAILGTRYEARVVLWRFDKLMGGLIR